MSKFVDIISNVYAGTYGAVDGPPSLPSILNFSNSYHFN